MTKSFPSKAPMPHRKKTLAAWEGGGGGGGGILVLRKMRKNEGGVCVSVVILREAKHTTLVIEFSTNCQQKLKRQSHNL